MPMKMDFSGSRIRVYWDGGLMIDTTDSVSPYLSEALASIRLIRVEPINWSG